MKINSYTPEARVPDQLKEMLKEKYGASEDFEFFLNDYETAWSFCIDNPNVSFHPIEVVVDGKLIAHISLILDKRLQAGEAFFGFMEFPHDTAVFNAAWNALVEKAKENDARLLKGPVNGSIWHQYRCIKESDSTPFFKAEPFSMAYYYEFLREYKPTAELQYYSASREPFAIVLRLLERGSLAIMKSLGFSIREAKSVTRQELQKIAEISRMVFKQSWGYTELDEREFVQLYSAGKVSAHLNALYLLYKGEEIIGFCSTMKENDSTLICKTIAILPQYQGKGLGNALAYTVHAEAEKAGYKKMIYALIREGNNIKNFPKQSAVIFRRYSGFEFTL